MSGFYSRHLRGREAQSLSHNVYCDAGRFAMSSQFRTQSATADRGASAGIHELSLAVIFYWFNRPP
jgi:hypothetical protein